MEIKWVNRGLVIASVGDRTIGIGGEYLVKHDPDFRIYARTVTSWDDGTPISESEQAELLDEVVAAASRLGWKFDISWDELDIQEVVERPRRQEKTEQFQERSDQGE